MTMGNRGEIFSASFQKQKFFLKPKNILYLALAFILIRNIPLCISLPIWVFGDEMAHTDYALKIAKGHIPQPQDHIEPELFLLHKVHRDIRFAIDRFVPPPNDVNKMGFGGYSYAAKHPPLPYLIYDLFRICLAPLGLSLIVQIKIMRIITLLAMSAGIIYLYSGLRKAGCQNPIFYYPLLFIALLSQDMYFSINNDSFSFCFVSFSLAQIFILFKNPLSAKNRKLLILGTILSLWTKITNVLLFPLWLLLICLFRSHGQRKKIYASLLLALFIAILLSAPWYIYNLIRFKDPVAFRYGSMQGEPVVSPQNLNWQSLKTFVLAFTRTLFRGDLHWHGNSFDILSPGLRDLFMSIIPILLFMIAAFPYLDPPHEDARPLLFLRRSAVGVMIALLCAYFFIGNIPFYQARFSFGALYIIIFMLAWGWKKCLRSDAAAFWVPVLMLLCYNIVYTSALLSKVLGPKLR